MDWKLTLCLILFFCTFIAVVFCIFISREAENEKQKRIEAERKFYAKEEELRTYLEQRKITDEKKKKSHQGDSVDNFNASLEQLQNASKR